ncbi:hydroxymethylbilane synthase, partial [Schumannella luteola]
DALCASAGRDLDGLPAGARVGTGSPRRRAQLLRRRPDLEVVDIRGNVDTRLGRLDAADPERRLDAVVLAAAGLDRLGRNEVVTEWLSLTSWPTAPAQGALAVETRVGDERSVSKLEHRPSRMTAEAERGVLARLEAGCAAPLGVSAIFEDGLLFLSARVYAPDGSEHLTASHALYPEDSRDPGGELAERVA